MSEKFQNKYRSETTRLKSWGYGWNASYFVTICTKNRICYFGDIKNGEMIMNDMGLIARHCWMAIPGHFPFVKLGNHVIMPNHVHGIVVIDKPDADNDGANVGAQNFATLRSSSSPSSKNKFGPQSQNLASIIRGFKIGVTKNARMINPEFAWQSRYHDHIIRNEKSFQKISEYIKNNPANWQDDTFR